MTVRLVWEAVRDRPDRTGLPIDQIPDRIYAATSRRVTREQTQEAVNFLVVAGCLYWRDPRRPRRLLHARSPEVAVASPVAAAQPLALFNVGEQTT